jgi:urocanate hydratase
MVVVVDGSDDAQQRLSQVLTSDPGIGIVRHADAGYIDAIERGRPRRHRLAGCSCR